MRWMIKGIWIVALALISGCGVPRAAGPLAAQGVATLTTMPADDAGVREALIHQADAWTQLAVLVRSREFGGIGGVDQSFIALVEQTAALARRQRDLIDAGQDDPTLNRAALEKLRALWADAAKYLNP